MTRMMSSSNGGEHNKGIFTPPLEIQQDCTRAGTVRVGTSDENESRGAFTTRQTVTVMIKLEYLNTI